ncbi:unnamed protein product [Lactuca saligna]|uniref:Jacalin-type lectin domain-containing protein n=1 Tax=Lactuca saligna TaxID=75948 RepID=A0AA35Y231_LACSI|nr:unnamed protein product [Lactuca saligna]
MAGSGVWGTPWGGEGGIGVNTWEFIIPDGARLTKIDLSSGDALDFIRFTYKDQYGTHISEKFGGDGGSSHSITFADNEFLIGISGRVGSFDGSTVITSISFETNISTYGQYGTNPGTDFSFGVTRGKISGFYGKYGSYVDSLGVILHPYVA